MQKNTTRTPNSPTCSNALASQQHDPSEAHTEDGALAKVEHGQRGRGF